MPRLGSIVLAPGADEPTKLEVIAAMSLAESPTLYYTALVELELRVAAGTGGRA
jgi:hypothetical protein